MEITLSSELREFVERKVRSGSFPSADAVVSGALELLKQEDEIPPEAMEYLRREIEVGLEQSRRGESTPLDMDSIKRRVRERIGAISR